MRKFQNFIISQGDCHRQTKLFNYGKQTLGLL